MQGLRYRVLDDRAHLRRHEFVFCLRRELRVGQLHRKNAGEPLPHIVARGLHFCLLGQFVGFDVLIERARHRRSQSGQMRTAIALWNIVRKAQNGFLI